MSKRRKKHRSSSSERTVRATERAAEHAAEQARAAQEQTAVAKRALRWTLIVTVIVALLGVAGAIWGPLYVGRFVETEQQRKIYEAQINQEISTARYIREFLKDMPLQIGPSSHNDLPTIQRIVHEVHEQMVEIDQAGQLQELKDGQGVELSDVYIARRELFRRIDRLLVGAIAQAEYSEHPTPGHRDTTNYIFGAMNADMQFNIYLHAIKDAADAHSIPFPNDLWMVSPNLTGPMVDDGN